MPSLLDFGPTRCDMDSLNGRWMEITASQKFHPRGSHFIFLDANGRCTLALTATGKLWGWAMAPRSFAWGTTEATNGYWTSSATEGGSKLLVYPFFCNPGLVYKVPTTAAGGLAVLARLGELIDLVGVNDGTAQYANPAASTEDVLCVVGLNPDGDTNSIEVTINENETQKDT